MCEKDEDSAITRKKKKRDRPAEREIHKAPSIQRYIKSYLSLIKSVGQCRTTVEQHRSKRSCLHDLTSCRTSPCILLDINYSGSTYRFEVPHLTSYADCHRTVYSLLASRPRKAVGSPRSFVRTMQLPGDVFKGTYY